MNTHNNNIYRFHGRKLMEESESRMPSAAVVPMTTALLYRLYTTAPKYKSRNRERDTDKKERQRRKGRTFSNYFLFPFSNRDETHLLISSVINSYTYLKHLSFFFAFIYSLWRVSLTFSLLSWHVHFATSKPHPCQKITKRFVSDQLQVGRISNLTPSSEFHKFSLFVRYSHY